HALGPLARRARRLARAPDQTAGRLRGRVAPDLARRPHDPVRPLAPRRRQTLRPPRRQARRPAARARVQPRLLRPPELVAVDGLVARGPALTWSHSLQSRSRSCTAGTSSWRT